MKQEIEFWNWFQDISIRLYECLDNKSELFRELRSRLKRIDGNLTYEISIVKENGKREFAISADGMINSFESVIKLVNLAPKQNLLNWEIVAFRQKDSNIGFIKFDKGFKVDIRKLKFNYTYETDTNQVSLRIYCESPEKNEKYYNIGIPVLLDALLGEYDAVTKIKHLNILDFESTYDAEKLQMEQLPEIINNLKNN